MPRLGGSSLVLETRHVDGEARHRVARDMQLSNRGDFAFAALTLTPRALDLFARALNLFPRRYIGLMNEMLVHDRFLLLGVNPFRNVRRIHHMESGFSENDS
jgi:hypothetical protein